MALASEICNLAQAASYQRTQESAFRRYRDACRFIDAAPTPATYQTVAHWLVGDIFFMNKKASASLTDAANLKAYFVRHGLSFMPDPRDGEQHSRLLSGIRVRETRPVTRPTPLTFEHLGRIARLVSFTDPHQTQLWLQLLLSHDCMLRSGTTCGSKVRVEHVHLLPDGVVRIDLHKIKHARHMMAAFPVYLHPSKCTGPGKELATRCDTAVILREYLMRTGLHYWPDAPLFAKLDSRGRVARPYIPQTQKNWNSQLRSLCARAGVPGKVTAQACRAGGLVDAIENGVPMALALAIGRWRSARSAEPYLRPGQHGAQLFRSALDSAWDKLAAAPGGGASPSRNCNFDQASP